MKNEKLKPYVKVAFFAYVLWLIIFLCMNEKTVSLCIGNTVLGIVLFGITLYKRKKIIDWLFLHSLVFVAVILHAFEFVATLKFVVNGQPSIFQTLDTEMKVLFVVSGIVMTINIICFCTPNENDYHPDRTSFRW